MTADWVAFLKARLDEDEQAARATRPAASKPAIWNVEPWYDGTAERADLWDTPLGPLTNHGGLEVATAAHIARHDPARVLREVAAKRRVIDLHSRGGEPSDHLCRECANPYPCETVRLLALPDADHSDY